MTDIRCNQCNRIRHDIYAGICQSCYKRNRIKQIQEQAPLKKCECGDPECHEMIPSIGKNGKPLRFKNGHSSKGDLNGRWNGGLTEDSYGYVKILSPNHPNKDSKGYVKRSRLTMEKYLGRYLDKNELVHHKNEIKSDDRLENLQLITRSAHQNHHNPRKDYRMDYTGVACLECGSDTTYPSKNGQPHWCRHPTTGAEYICEKCYKRISSQTRTKVLYRRKKDISNRACELCGVKVSESSSGQSTWRLYSSTIGKYICKSCFDTKVRKNKSN